MKRWASLTLLALALSLLALYVSASGVSTYVSTAPGSCVQQGFLCHLAVRLLRAGRELSVLLTDLLDLASNYLQAAMTFVQTAVASLLQHKGQAAALKAAIPKLASLDWNPVLISAVLVVISTTAWLFIRRRPQPPAPSATCKNPAPFVKEEAPFVIAKKTEVSRQAIRQKPVPTPVQSERHVVEQSLEQMAAEAAERMVEARLSVLEQQVVAALQLALLGNPGPVQDDQVGRLRALAGLNLKFSQMEAPIPILDADRVDDSDAVDSIAAALSDEVVESVLAMPVFRNFTKVERATAQPRARKLAVATLLVLLRCTAMAPQAHEDLRAILTALVTPDTRWSTLNNRFFNKWDDLSGAVSAAVVGEEHLAEFKHAKVAASVMLALLMSEGLVLSSA